MARITAIINQKGGVGKTTTATTLASGLKLRGYRVLVIDADPQGNCSYIMKAARQHGTSDLLKGKPIMQLIQHVDQADIISSSDDLVGADRAFSDLSLLKNALRPVLGMYDHIIIDCPPATGIITFNALTAASDVVVPVGANVLSLQGLGQLFESVAQVKQHSNRDLKIAGLLICRKNGRAVLTKQFTEAIEEVAQQQRVRLYQQTIRESVAICEAQALQESIFNTHRKAAVTADYAAFIDEYLK